MNKWISLWVGLAGMGGIAGGETVTVPWSEFSELYRQRIEEEVRKQTPPAEPRHLYAMQGVLLDLEVRDNYLIGTMACEGKVIEGDPRVPLLGPSVMVEKVSALEGGELLLVDGKTILIPSGDLPFRVTLEILVPLEDSGTLLSTEFALPQAIQRTLRLQLPENLRLIEHPGLRDHNGVFHLPSDQPFFLKIARTPDAGENRSVELDALTRIALHGKRLVCTTFYHPVRTLHRTVEVALPPDAKWKASSLPPVQVQQEDGTTYRIGVSPGDPTPFHIQYTLETSPADSGFLLELPMVSGNEGEDRFLVIDQPESGQIEIVPGKDEFPLHRVAIPRSFLASTPVGASCILVPRGKSVPLQITRFTTVDTPPAVLDAIRFFTSFEENGGRLSQLWMDVPAAVGPRMFIERISEADIWSLTVNGEPRQVRTGADGNWVVALDPEGPSKVELAYLTKAEALGLHGRIEARMPGVGLPAKRVTLGIGLPDRVELLSIDGPVTPVARPSSGPPEAFAGTPYYFSRSYYEGKGLQLSAYFKEPAGNDLASP
jgi:hypothetical protein